MPSTIISNTTILQGDTEVYLLRIESVRDGWRKN